MKPELDGRAFKSSSWQRAEGWLPVVETVYHDPATIVTMQVLGGVSAAIIRIEMENKDNIAHQVTINCSNPDPVTVYNPAGVQSDWDSDVLLAGMRDRADRIIAIMLGGDEQPVKAATTISQVWNLKANEKRVGWIIRPYQAYHSQLVILRHLNWQEAFDSARQAWYKLKDRAVKISLPDHDVQNAFYAGLADCFVMREPVSGEFIASTPGTENYRASNAGEASIVAVFLDQVGLPLDAALGFQMVIEQQGIDGNWNDPKGWAHYMWGTAGLKAWAVMNHYLLTKDKDYLTAVYPRMVASSKWQEAQRAKTRLTENGERSLTYGLMPRGMGDCGLKDGDDYYGIFLPHNILAVFADSLTREAARILGKSTDVEELSGIYHFSTKQNSIKP